MTHPQLSDAARDAGIKFAMETLDRMPKGERLARENDRRALEIQLNGAGRV